MKHCRKTSNIDTDNRNFDIKRINTVDFNFKKGQVATGRTIKKFPKVAMQCLFMK